MKNVLTFAFMLTLAVSVIVLSHVVSFTRKSHIVKKSITLGATNPTQTVVGRESVMDYCDLVVDIMFRPYFWSSIESCRYNTIEHVVAHIQKEQRPHYTVYIPLPVLHVLWNKFVHQIPSTVEVTLFSNHGDEPLDAQVLQQLDGDAQIRCIYVNNVPLNFQSHRKVRYIPIGFSQDIYYRRCISPFVVSVNMRRIPGIKRWMKQHPKVNVLDMQPRKPLHLKARKVLCAFSNTGCEWTVPTLRRQCRDYLTEQEFGAVMPFMEKKNYFDLHEEYAFEVSPFGNGLECHRTWEALLLHTIPIVFHSPVDVLYKGLPVIIVNHVEDITQSLLDHYAERYATYFEDHDIRQELNVRRWIES